MLGSSRLRRLLAGVHELDAVALVLERRAVLALQIHPAALLAVVLVVLVGGLLAKVYVAYGPHPSVIRDDERDRANVPRRMGRDERCPVRVTADRAARVEDRARRIVDRVDEARAVVAVEGADECVELRRA